MTNDILGERADNLRELYERLSGDLVAAAVARICGVDIDEGPGGLLEILSEQAGMNEKSAAERVREVIAESNPLLATLRKVAER